MCGIAGFLQDSELHQDSAAIIAQMATSLIHRGPDDSGSWLDAQAGIALGHRRLAIIDPSAAGHQPMTSASGRFVIVYNGEIYNYGELRSELTESLNREWRGHSDTEVLLAAIDRWGTRGALDRLNGMFALAVWDRETRTLVLARDRMGEKPLYHGRHAGTFMFGSELKALRAHPSFAGSLDRSSLAAMLRYDYVPAPDSIWQGISKLEPGHFVEIADGGRRIGDATPYWSLRESAIAGSERRLADGPELVGAVERLLKDAVAKRMVADVPLGAFLSGGIDSSLVVALMQAQSSRPVRTFTIGFEDRKFNEAPHAKRIAEHLQTDHTELYVTARDALDVIPRIPRIWDEPFGGSSQIPTYLVSEMARHNVTVALSGDGADELFGGYGRFNSTVRIWKWLNRIPPAVRPRLAQLVGSRSYAASLGQRQSIARILSSQTFEQLYQWKISRAQHPEALVQGASERAPSESLALPILASPSDKMFFRDMRRYLPDNILTKVDRASMAVSLEVRAPFLDNHMVEFAWRVPLQAKLSAGGGKLILRSLLRRYVPTELIDRPKMGFAVPIASWLRGPLRAWAEDLLSEERLARQAVLDPLTTRRLWREFLSGKAGGHRVVWNLLMFQEWLDAVV